MAESILKNPCSGGRRPSASVLRDYEFGKSFLTELKVRESVLWGSTAVAKDLGEL